MIDFLNKTTQSTPLCVLDTRKCVSIPSTFEGIRLSKNMTFKQLLDATKCKGFINHTEAASSQMSMKLFEFARSRQTIQLFPTFSFNLPSASSLARSDTGRQRIMNNFEERHIYENWFAMKIYESEVTEPAKDLAQKVQSILHFEFSKEAKVLNREETYTSVLSSAFDVFLHHAHYCCLHQVAICSTERPDFYMAKEGEKGCLLSWPSLLADYKIDRFELAVAETFKYYISMLDKSHDNFPALLMPCCSQKFQLCLCIPYRGAKQIVMIKIMEAEVNDRANLAKLFSAMHYGVTHLHPMMFNNLPFVPTPIEELKLNNYMYMSEGSFRVLKCNGKIYKFYDTEEEIIFPNKEIIEGLGSDYLPDMEVKYLTTCKRFQMFSYRYMEQSMTKPNSLHYFKNVMQALDTLHARSLVHSDVRFGNLLFLDEDAKIIDFDHADAVGTSYPSNFNFQLCERHPDLLNGKVTRRLTSHDRYSLAFIILVTLQETLTENEKSFFEGIQNGSDENLCNICDRACENQPSSRIKIALFFQLCSFTT